MDCALLLWYRDGSACEPGAENAFDRRIERGGGRPSWWILTAADLERKNRKLLDARERCQGVSCAVSPDPDCPSTVPGGARITHDQWWRRSPLCPGMTGGSWQVRVDGR